MGLFTKQQDVTDLLTADHETVREMLGRLLEHEGREAQSLLRDIRREIDIHSKVEEEIVYPAYRACMDEHGADVMVQEALTEHQQANRLLDELSRLEPASVAFEGKARVLKESIEHHAQEEEKVMFKGLRKGCSREQLEQLAWRVEQRKQELD